MNIFSSLKDKYPIQTAYINGADFTYRYYKNEASDKTIVLLTGGLGLSDLLLLHFEEFAKSYSVLVFDYHIAYATIQELVDAIAALLKKLDIKAFLVGQSLGGFVAQILAQQYPEVVEGMVLSNTGTLSVDMNDNGVKCLEDMISQIDKSLFMLKITPFGFMKKSIKKAVMKKTSGQLSEQERELMAEVCDEMVRSLTKEYETHMTLLLKDIKNHWNMQAKDFAAYENKVLLILSDDDLTFNDGVKQALIDIMPKAPVVTDIRGGHIALLVKMDRYVQTVKTFIDNAR